MFDVAYVPNSTAEVKQQDIVSYSVTYETLNCSKQILCHSLMLCSSNSLLKIPPRMLVTAGFSWNNYGFHHMSWICQPLQVLYIDNPFPLFYL